MENHKKTTHTNKPKKIFGKENSMEERAFPTNDPGSAPGHRSRLGGVSGREETHLA